MRMRGIPKVKKMEVFPERKPVSSLNEWSKEIQAEFNYFNKMLRKHREKGDGVSTFDLTEAMSRRRRRALLNTMEEIYKRYDKAGTALPALGETWIELNLPFETYSHLDRHSHLLFGASIWILDQISSHEGWREVYRLLPTEEDLLDELCYHDVWDSQYAYDLIYSVEYVLHNRNPIESDGAKYERVLTSDYLARISNAGTAIEGDQNRKNFEALIAMIPQEAIDLAVTHFKDSFWDWVERYFKHAEPLLKAVEECEDKIRDSQLTFNRLADLLNASIERVEKARRSTGKSKPIGASNLSVLNKTKNVLELAAQKKQAPLPFGEFSAAGILSPNGQDPERDKLLDESIELSMKADKMHERIDETIDQANALHTEVRKYSMYMARQGRITRDNADDIKGAAISPMEPLSIADPYEMCFALLYLIEKDDDLPWLYGAGCGLMGEVIETLPWGIIEYDEMDDEAWEELPPPLPKSITIPNPYERNYRMKDDFDFPRNLAQIIYEETGCILPRNLHVYDGKAKLLGKYGIRGKDAAAALMLMSTLGMNRRSAEALNFDADLDFGHDEMEAGPREKTEEKENQTVSLEELRAENKRLKAALHAADKENRDTKKKMASLKTTADREHRELSDLREYVFNQEAEEGALEEEIDETKWPYEVQRDTVVFGGHATWAKGIKGILTGNIRFIDKDLIFDTGLVKHAEVIWIQPNALSHPMYWRVLDTARIYGKPVRYFAFASWIKCAEQVVTWDQSLAQ